MKHLLLTLLVLFTFSLTLNSERISEDSSIKTGSIVFQEHKNGFGFVEGMIPTAIARGSFRDFINETGWGTLEIITNGAYADQDQAYWLGFLEGALTYERIWQHYLNVFAWNYGQGGRPTDDLVQFITDQKQWLEDNVELYVGQTESSDDPLWIYWNQVSLMLTQFDGLVDGYNSISLNPITSLDLWLLNSDGDLITLFDIYPQKTQNRLSKVSENGEDFHECSALIKLVNTDKKKRETETETETEKRTGSEYNELYTGHNTWRAYAAMLRVYKFYYTQFSEQSHTASNIVAFSTAPAFLSSKDDYYLTSTGLASIETTNSIYNETLYDLYISPQTVLCWQRAILANRLSKTGSDWVNVFAQYNSGTYNNQWMVVDYKVFATLQNSNKKLTKQDTHGVLTILEQIPGFCQIGDVSDVLFENGYWGSYNIPYFQNIYEMSGYPEKYAQYGDKYSYTNCSRARIFRRDNANVVEMDEMQRIMRYNDFENDPESQGNPTYTISSRYDLKSAPTVRDAYGGVDTKITSFSLIQTLSGWAQSGPTHDQQNPFSWANWTASVSDQPQHIGHPDTFDFDFVYMAPKLFQIPPFTTPVTPSPVAPGDDVIEPPIFFTPIIDAMEFTRSDEQ